MPQRPRPRNWLAARLRAAAEAVDPAAGPTAPVADQAGRFAAPTTPVAGPTLAPPARRPDPADPAASAPRRPGQPPEHWLRVVAAHAPGLLHDLVGPADDVPPGPPPTADPGQADLPGVPGRFAPASAGHPAHSPRPGTPSTHRHPDHPPGSADPTGTTRPGDPTGTTDPAAPDGTAGDRSVLRTPRYPAQWPGPTAPHRDAPAATARPGRARALWSRLRGAAGSDAHQSAGPGVPGSSGPPGWEGSGPHPGSARSGRHQESAGSGPHPGPVRSGQHPGAGPVGHPAGADLPAVPAGHDFAPPPAGTPQAYPDTTRSTDPPWTGPDATRWVEPGAALWAGTATAPGTGGGRPGWSDRPGPPAGRPGQPAGPGRPADGDTGRWTPGSPDGYAATGSGARADGSAATGSGARFGGFDPTIAVGDPAAGRYPAGDRTAGPATRQRADPTRLVLRITPDAPAHLCGSPPGRMCGGEPTGPAAPGADDGWRSSGAPPTDQGVDVIDHGPPSRHASAVRRGAATRWPADEPNPPGDPWPALPGEPTATTGTVHPAGTRDTWLRGGTAMAGGAGVPAGAVADPWPALPDDSGWRAPTVTGWDDARHGRLDAEQRGV